MALKEAKGKAIYLLQNQVANVAVAAATEEAMVVDGDFSVAVWSPTADFDGGTVNVYMLAPDRTPILLESFTGNGVRFGRVGQVAAIFKAELTGTAGSADVCVAVSN